MRDNLLVTPDFMDTQIEHVSDTALIVTAARAFESERPDPLIRDPFAARLAGKRGMALVKNVQVPQWLELGLGMRTRFVDEFITFAVANGTNSVLSLGAGLDARPWRLDLPASFRWTEVDFGTILDYKYAMLEGIAPHCQLERRSADLNQASGRRQILADAAAEARRPLLITEGLLTYLPAETVCALAAESREAGFEFWLVDFTSSVLLRRAYGPTMEQMARVRAESYLEDPAIRETVEQQGWKPIGRRLFVEDGPKLAMNRIQKLIETEGWPLELPQNDDSGVWLYRQILKTR
jgi:methyltransferase (TIGR00027 family)